MNSASSASKRPVLPLLGFPSLPLGILGCLLSSVLCIPASAQIEVVSGGNVGIGTTSPANRLHIDGTTGTPTSMPLRVDLGDSGSIAVRGSSSITYAGFTSYKDATQMWFAGREGDNYVLRTGAGTNVLTAENSGAVASTLYLKAGNVGIGTATPSQKLSVMGIGLFGLNDAGTNNIGGILVASGTGVGGARQYWIGASNPTSHNNNMFQISDYNGSTNSPLLTIFGTHAGSASGNVGIGTTNPGYKLEVAGQVRATSFISNTTTYADFVFRSGYKLPSLSEVEAHIAEHGTLPGVPSEAQVAKEGIDLAAMQVQLLQKVEELTLHAIAQHKEIAALRQELAALKNQ